MPHLKPLLRKKIGNLEHQADEHEKVQNKIVNDKLASIPSESTVHEWAHSATKKCLDSKLEKIRLQVVLSLLPSLLHFEIVARWISNGETLHCAAALLGRQSQITTLGPPRSIKPVTLIS